ncbi:hypothetical protein P9027_30325 [Bacillus thuringiensis]|uniref:hypothetical protein n=1 Tax=Bacillus thuringiensis TaxID=1428 RepID=UPI002DB95279|nr:hypothetical protein [Bacillus thuringiensis]MEC3226215.1 hypothetical protein [Bacillus thuringiensis]MEC3463565.1 hypothetical protein [Bacillus thuringiensis]MEC3556642.1 hypothetical protein [Bacillus thuringiensis]MED2061338.1 hypothetical protein [Bacillus thuringiensis]
MPVFHVWYKKGKTDEDKLHQIVGSRNENKAILKSDAYKEGRCIDDVGIERYECFKEESNMPLREELLELGWAFRCTECYQVVGDGIILTKVFRRIFCECCKEKIEKEIYESSYFRKDIDAMLTYIFLINSLLIIIGTCMSGYIYDGISLPGFVISFLLWCTNWMFYHIPFNQSSFDPDSDFKRDLIAIGGFTIIPILIHWYVTGGIPNWLNLDWFNSWWLNLSAFLILAVILMIIAFISVTIFCLLVHDALPSLTRWLERQRKSYWIVLNYGDWVIYKGCTCQVISSNTLFHSNRYSVTLDECSYLSIESITRLDGYFIVENKKNITVFMDEDEIERVATEEEIQQEINRRSKSKIYEFKERYGLDFTYEQYGPELIDSRFYSEGIMFNNTKVKGKN